MLELTRIMEENKTRMFIEEQKKQQFDDNVQNKALSEDMLYFY